jgi:hypothetical protein
MSSVRPNIMLNPKQHLIYEPNLFVNRQREIDIVENKIRLVQSDQTVSEAVINFWGSSGIGKTWILKQLKNKFSFHPSVENKYPTFTLFFEFSNSQSKNIVEKLAKSLANQITNQLSLSLPSPIRSQIENAAASGSIEDLADLILELSKNFISLILFDNTENVQAEVWEEIERQFFEPIISTGRTLVIVSGRRQVPRWRRFEVRRRVMEPNQSQVRPFDKRAVTNQIKNRKVSIPASSLFPYTAGNPHLVDTLLNNIQTWKQVEKKTKIDDIWLHAHQADLLKVLKAAEHEFLNKIEPRLKRPLIAVASLRFYRLEAMRFMLTNGNIKDKDQPDGYYLGIVRELDQETDVVWWDRERRAYVTSEVVRKLINRRQLLENRDRFISSHKCALEMYRSWANEFPRTSEEFLVEMLFHYASIFEVTKNVSNLRSNFMETLQMASKLITDRLVILQKQIDIDRELMDLLPEKLYEELHQQVEALLKKSSDFKN